MSSNSLARYIPANLIQQSQLPAALSGYMPTDELEQNIGASFAVVSIRGKVFRIKYRKNETDLLVPFNGMQVPAPNFDVVIVATTAALSKSFYRGGYESGSNEQPDCWSEDGVRPGAPNPVHPDCATCPMNKFGSKVSDSGQKLKACSDTRKLVILPIANLANENFGGPMLLRVPAASLGTLAEYSRALNQQGIPYFAVVTRLTFFQAESYPKLDFQALRTLTDEEARFILAAREGDIVQQILTSAQATAPAVPSSVAAVAGQAAPGALAPPPQFGAPAPQAAPPAVAPPPPVFAAPPAPAAPAFPPEGWTQHPQSPAHYFKGQEVLTEAQLRERMAPPVPAAPPVPVAPPIPSAPPVPAAVPTAAPTAFAPAPLPGSVPPPAAAAPAPIPAADPGFLSMLDSALLPPTS